MERGALSLYKGRTRRAAGIIGVAGWMWCMHWFIAAQTATSLPSVRVMTFLPAALETVSRPTAERLHVTLTSFVGRNPNFRMIADPQITVAGRPSEIPSLIPSGTDYVLYAQILKTSGAETDVAVTLLSMPTKDVANDQRFRTNESDLPAFAEIAVESLLGQLLAANLGVIRIEANEAPASVRLFSISSDGLRQSFPESLFKTNHLPDGVELLSRPLLRGDYEVSVEFAGQPPIRRNVAILPGEPTIIALNSGRAPSETRPMPTRPSPMTSGISDGTTNLSLFNLSPGQAVYLSRDAEPPMAAFFVCIASGVYRLEWLSGLAAVTIGAGAEPTTAVLKGIPEGRYMMGTWRVQEGAYGKAHFSGWGAFTPMIATGREPAISATLLPEVSAPTRLNLFWTPAGPPSGARLFVDDKYVGDVFDAGELSVFDLPAGERRVRFEAAGFAPVETSVHLRQDAETSAFFALRPE